MGIFDFLKPFNNVQKRPANWREAAKQGGYSIKTTQVRPKTGKAELDHLKKLGVKKVKVKSSEDQRVCQECKKHSNKIYTLNLAPILPICHSCRCYYEPIIT